MVMRSAVTGVPLIVDHRGGRCEWAGLDGTRCRPDPPTLRLDGAVSTGGSNGETFDDLPDTTLAEPRDAPWTYGVHSTVDRVDLGAIPGSRKLDEQGFGRRDEQSSSVATRSQWMVSGVPGMPR
jgi:hypothetical protein